MVSGENPSGCSDLEIFNDTTTAISNLYLPILLNCGKNIPTIPSLGI